MNWAVLKLYGVEEKLIIILQSIYENAKAALRVETDLGQWFKQEKGVIHGDPTFPNVFTTYLEQVMLKTHGHTINNLKLVDDIELIENKALRKSRHVNKNCH